MTRRIVPLRFLGPLVAIAVGACGAQAAEPATPSAGGEPAAEPTPSASGPGLAPPVPTAIRSRTLLTQPVEEEPPPPPPPPVLAGSSPAGERMVGAGAIPEPRAVREDNAGGRANGLDAFKVRDVIHAAQGRIRHCFDRLRQDRPRVTEARVSVRLEIAPAGNVEEVEVTGCAPEDDAFAGCVRAFVRSLDFPPASAPTVTTYPFVFSVASGDQ